MESLPAFSRCLVPWIRGAKRKNVQTWKQLESALLDALRKRYFQLQEYNKVRPKAAEGLFRSNALQKLVARFEP
jgi:hypothetical protein